MSTLQEIQQFVNSLSIDVDYQNATYGKVIIDPEDLVDKIAEFIRSKGCFPEPNSTLKYFVNGKEVTKEEYVAAERRNGFYNTIGFPDEPATSYWSNSKTGDTGRTVYGRSDTAVGS